uniref:STAS domain-containing protein n=1 Tax=Acrobeloides nanus TaxID=290746 RepID=A0A914CED0_9BILA
MHQEEFDAKFLYQQPKPKHNFFIRQARIIFRSYYRPCLSTNAFINAVISFVPIIQWLPKYNFQSNLLNDIIGGITVGVLHVPQGIAYAILANVPPVIGLYTSFFPPLFYMIFGTSRLNSIGSFAVVSLMAGVTVNRIQAEYSTDNELISNSNSTSNLIIPGAPTAIILYLGQWLRTLPMCVLSAIIIFALKGMFKKVMDLRTLWPLSKIDFVICSKNFFMRYINLEHMASKLFVNDMLGCVGRPRWHFLSRLSGTNDYRDDERYQYVEHDNGICIFRFDSPLLFTNVDYFKKCIDKAAIHWQNRCPYKLTPEKIQALEQKRENNEINKNKTINIDQIKEPPVLVQSNPNVETVMPDESTIEAIQQHFIVDCSGFTFVDYMGVNALKEIFTEMSYKNVIVYFAAAKAPVRDLFEASGFYTNVPKSNFYPTIRDAVAIAKKRQHESAAYFVTEIAIPHDPLDALLKAQPVN